MSFSLSEQLQYIFHCHLTLIPSIKGITQVIPPCPTFLHTWYVYIGGSRSYGAGTRFYGGGGWLLVPVPEACQ